MEKGKIDSIKDFRKERGISMEKVSDSIGVSRQKYSRFERGDGFLTIEELDNLLELLDLGVYDVKPQVEVVKVGNEQIEINAKQKAVIKKQSRVMAIQSDIIVKLVGDVERLKKLIEQINKVSNEEQTVKRIQTDISKIKKRFC